MKNNYFVVLLLFFCLQLAIGQTSSERQAIVATYDVSQLYQLATDFDNTYQDTKNAAIQRALIDNIPVRITLNDGGFAELQRFSADGNPIYYRTFNVAAARSTRANHLNIGGSLGLNLDGQNMTAYVWDGGHARVTHQEYDGPGGNNRVTVEDASTEGGTQLNFHAAHVTGTITASGVQANAKGMAPRSRVRGYMWNNDLSEATTAAANGMLISNHSYGFRSDLVPDQYFGAYIQDSRDWDNVMYNAPFYLMVVAAGNDGNTNYNGNPLNGNSAYDKLTGHSTSKNNLVVANAQDANVDNSGNLISVTINSGSSEGPTDDLRIKPDITGNGTSVYSTYHNSNTAYNSITGTSMASPNVAGSLLLLQQHHNNLNGSFMRAATLKGLALHTADDAGPSGPDAVYGWGLMNSKFAAETISNEGTASTIDELVLNSGQSYSITVQSDGINDLMASISWTDVPGQVVTATNSPNAVLVNDLDIRVSQNSTVYSPYRLTSITSNGTGDNTKDPYERVAVSNASGSYTITVTHKGSLSSGSQAFSLIVTGITSGGGGGPTSCTNGISSFPYSESFESSFGGWTQSSTDDIDWSRDSGGTPSSNTGPSTGSDGSTYIYVEASGNGTGYPNKQAILTSPCFDLSSASNASFNFDYHMFGAADMGSIDVEVSINNGGSWSSLWNETGNQGNTWNSASIDLSSYIGSSIQLRFNRVTGSTWQADIAIDNIELSTSGGGGGNGCTASVSLPYAESFEASFGDWTQSSADDIDWSRDSNGTPSSNTGPSNATDGNIYIFVEASGNGTGYPNKRAILNSPCFDLSTESAASFGFDYHMYGAADMGSITLEASTDNGSSWTPIWSQTGNQGNSWNSESIDLAAYLGGSVQLRFNRLTGSTWQADIALDNLSLSAGGGNNQPPTGYCSSNGNNTNDEYIQRVQLGSINNVTGASPGGYGDYTNLSTTLNNSNTITITPAWTGTVYAEGYAVWIDWNRDGDFNDSGELVYSRSATTASPVSGTFSIPSGASLGATVMRVSMKYNDIPDPCESFTYGEVEDYVVIVSSNTNGQTTQTQTSPLSTQSINILSEISLYPNPVTRGLLNVVISEAKPTKYSIYNSLGQLVQSGNYNSQLDVGNLQSGLYHIEVFTEGGANLGAPFIKQ